MIAVEESRSSVRIQPVRSKVFFNLSMMTTSCFALLDSRGELPVPGLEEVLMVYTAGIS